MYTSEIVTRFRSDSIPAAHREAVVREELWQNIYRMDMVSPDPAAIRFDFHLRSLPDLYCQYSRMSAARLLRDRSLAARAGNRLALVSYFDGAVQVRQGNTVLELAPADTFLVFMNTAAEFDVPDSRFICMDFEYRSLAPLLGSTELPALSKLPPSAELRMLLRYAGELMRQDEHCLSPELASLAVRQLQELMALVIRGNQDEQLQHCGAVQRARLRAARSIISQRLHDPSFSQGELAGRLGISTRSVQHLFASIQTTFTSYLLEQRLALTQQKLSSPLCQHIPITSLALDAGFGDLSYFNRRFRQRYGLTPSEWRAENRN